MRELQFHRVHGLADYTDPIRIFVIDEPGAGGANHEYDITIPDASDDGNPSLFTEIRFQNGPVLENGVNGITIESLISIGIDRLESFQSGPFPCDENASALAHLHHAMHWLQQRTRARVAARVEGRTLPVDKDIDVNQLGTVDGQPVVQESEVGNQPDAMMPPAGASAVPIVETVIHTNEAGVTEIEKAAVAGDPAGDGGLNVQSLGTVDPSTGHPLASNPLDSINLQPIDPNQAGANPESQEEQVIDQGDGGDGDPSFLGDATEMTQEEIDAANAELEQK